MANHDLSFATVCGSLIVMVVSRESPDITPMRVLLAPEPRGRALRRGQELGRLGEEPPDSGRDQSGSWQRGVRGQQGFAEAAVNVRRADAAEEAVGGERGAGLGRGMSQS